jgi:hypothetical protein
MFSVTRPAVGICFALLASGCGGGSRLPSGPTPSGSPSGPTGSALTGPYIITGVVADESGRPIAGASPDACCVSGGTYSHWQKPGVTDANGRFQMTGIPGGTLLWFRVFKDGYVPQCAAPPVTVQGDLAIALPLVSTANLTATAPSAPGFRSVSGTIVTATTIGKEAVAGAVVAFSPYEDFEPAWTYSDQAGRFALCGFPLNETVTIGAFVRTASVPSLRGYVTVPPGQTTDVELVLQ